MQQVRSLGERVSVNSLENKQIQWGGCIRGETANSGQYVWQDQVAFTTELLPAASKIEFNKLGSLIKGACPASTACESVTC